MSDTSNGHAPVNAVIGIVLALLFVQNSHPPTGDEIVSADPEASLATTSA
jgi:hypothetical protein